MILTKNYLEKLDQYQLADLAEFIVSENYNHHAGEVAPSDYRKEVKSIYQQEADYYDNSVVYVAKDYIGQISASIRVLRWNYMDLLPIQKIFGINPLHTIENSNDIFHIGRFAIKKDVRDIKLLKQLMICAIAPVCQHENNVAFAECDSKLLRTLALLGIKATQLGEAVNYLGSETIPIALEYSGLIGFYNKYKGLVTEDTLVQTETSPVHKSVVMDYYQHYYSFV
ncbi:MAG: hypothetical protein P1U56_06800 [Saprospiraceae bacterium]|nr:hypothetical protein [Saprospiraceae bacterium]